MASPFLKTYEVPNAALLDFARRQVKDGIPVSPYTAGVLFAELDRLLAQQQAFADGYEAHRAGKPASACPHGTDALPLYHAWKFGWKHRDWHVRAMRAEAKAGELLRGGDGGPVLAGSLAGDLDWEL